MSDVYTPFDSGLDPSVEELRSPDAEGTTALIRTSDRIAFKKCRRRWGWNSHMRGNLGPKESQNPLWYGTGMHYALEDFHGRNVYGKPSLSFLAYCEATYKNRSKVHVPASFDDLKKLGIGMMQYYETWLANRDPLKTLIWKGVPQVEVRARIEVPFNVRKHFPDSPYSRVEYGLTIDRVIEDEEDGLWLIDYKSAKAIQTLHYATDPQIGVYYWAAHQIYPGRHIAGFIYQQHRKDIPEPPRMLASGRISVDKRQLTTHRAYRKVLQNIFGTEVAKWPPENLTFLNELAKEEGPDSDKFIRRDKIYRNQHAHEAEGTKILLELEDMLNPNLPLYPNPTRDCAYMCPFLHACISMDDGSDWQHELDLAHNPRQKEEDSWRKLLPPPSTLASQPLPQIQW